MLPTLNAERYAAGTDGVCFLAEHAGEAVGMTYGFLDETQPHVSRLGGMWVARQNRRAGVGAVLVSRVRAWAIERGRTELRFHVFHRGPEAQRFYRSQGFAIVDPQPDDAGFLEFGARLEVV
jgi:GNAT superfamily N-acetyltransferase